MVTSSRLDRALISHTVNASAGTRSLAHLIVIHHTDCGITRLAADTALLTHYFQVSEGELKAKAVTDPRTAVAVDVAALRAIDQLPGRWLLSGLVCDAATGLVEVVVPPAPIRKA